MKCYTQWFGGSGYSFPEADDYEIFESLGDAKDDFGKRLNDPYYPCVEGSEPEEGGPAMLVWFGPPEGEFPCDCYPDREITFGPRGGIRVSRT